MMKLSISSDYSQSCRKSRLFVDAVKLGSQLEAFWKGLKTKKIQSARVSFSEIDHYDSVIDVYTVPSFSIERGLRKARLSKNEHGSIPKDWSVDLDCEIAFTSTIGPLIEIIDAALNRYLSDEQRKKLALALRPVLQCKVTSVCHFIE
jgi:hypothetical protein